MADDRHRSQRRGSLRGRRRRRVLGQRRRRAEAVRHASAQRPSPAPSTVGGLASQGIPAGLDGILGLTVVLADGTVVRPARQGSSIAMRGPDVTGLFLGDCGAFGIKTEVVLRIAPEQPAAFASFGFDDVDPLLDNL